MSKLVIGVINVLTVLVVTTGVLYALFAFMCWSSVPNTWHPVARIAFAIIWFVWTFRSLDSLFGKKS